MERNLMKKCRFWNRRRFWGELHLGNNAHFREKLCLREIPHFGEGSHFGRLLPAIVLLCLLVAATAGCACGASGVGDVPGAGATGSAGSAAVTAGTATAADAAVAVYAVASVDAATATTATEARPSADGRPTETGSGKLYGIGSVSKIFTTAAVLKLAEDGLLDIDLPLTTYLPDFAMADTRYTAITPRMLLSHSSGLMGSTSNNTFLIGDNDTYLHDHFLALLKTQGLKHDPGDRSIYSNDSFTLAELLVERVSGMSFTDYILVSFAEPLGLTHIQTPQSDFDWDSLADIYLGNSELQPQTLGVIGSGGVYATAEDLCRFATLFMDSADGSVLGKSSVEEMAKIQHQMELVAPGTDTVFRYGLGWDCVEQYPFNRYGIQALSKGGSTFAYFANLTVLPAYDLAAAVVCSGAGGLESLVAQEIILAVLEEEGLIPLGAIAADRIADGSLNGDADLRDDSYADGGDGPGDAGLEGSLFPRGMTAMTSMLDADRAKVPEHYKSYAGVYAAGLWGLYSIAFTDDALIMTPIGVRNERPMTFLYQSDGRFVSTNGDFIGIFSTTAGAVGATAITFDSGYLMLQTYENIAGLSYTAEAMPFAEKITANPAPADAWDAWSARSGKEYLLASEKYSSGLYIHMPVAKTQTDERYYGYVAPGICEAGGASFPAAKIVDANHAQGYQNIPTMTGRDAANLSAANIDGREYFSIDNLRYVDAAAALPFSSLGGTIAIAGGGALWIDVDSGSGGKIVRVTTPDTGSWFVYDDKMNCIATSLEKNPRATIILPEGGRLALVGDAGAVFSLQ